MQRSLVERWFSFISQCLQLFDDSISFNVIAGPISEPVTTAEALTTEGKEHNQLYFSRVLGDLISILLLT